MLAIVARDPGDLREITVC